jgi:two-component system phosphate regulon response regulator PhoB/two-component system alkaline phosphatase synthesis response regulator PhoP
MNELIAIVEDEPDIIELVTIHLTKAGFNVMSFTDGQKFFQFLEKNIPDLVILDLMLPDMDGLEICKYVRKKDEFFSIPIIMLTAKSEETDKILGLELGADDYVTKPFSPRELVARVKAVLRRKAEKKETKQIRIGKILVLDIGRHEVTVSGKKTELTSTEFKILELLSSKKGWVFSREKILDYLWGEEKSVIDRTVDVHVRHLREKLGPASGLIKNIRGVGYKLEE